MVALALPSLPTIASAFLLKLTTSLDDLLWLSPFLSLSPSVQNKLKHSVVYFLICVVVTMIAFFFGTRLLALSGNGDEDHKRYWNPERLLSIFSASVLFYIAKNDYDEWWEQTYTVKDLREKTPRACNNSRAIAMGETTLELSNNKSSQRNLRSRPIASRQSSRNFDDPEDFNHEGKNDGGSDSDDEEIRTKVEEASKSLRRFVTVCVMGTLDDMIVFSAFVAGGANATEGGSIKDNYFALFIGTTFAALLIVTISWFFSEIECFKRIVKKIPMWALLMGIGVYILIMGLV